MVIDRASSTPPSSQPQITKTSKTLWSLLFSIVGFVAMWLVPLIGLLLGVTGLILGIKGRQTQKSNVGSIGIVLSKVVIFLSVAIWAVVIYTTYRTQLSQIENLTNVVGVLFLFSIFGMGIVSVVRKRFNTNIFLLPDNTDWIMTIPIVFLWAAYGGLSSIPIVGEKWAVVGSGMLLSVFLFIYLFVKKFPQLYLKILPWAILIGALLYFFRS